MTNLGVSSHIASILSMADILAVLYGEVLRYKPEEPKWAGRDRFILSKGHAGAGVYATLAESGFFPVEKLQSHYQDGSDLSGHVSHKGIPGVEFSTGSLGHGLPVAAGMALAAKINNENNRAFVLLGDGECDEGSNWEAIMFASHHKLDNLNLIVDNNRISMLDHTDNIVSHSDLAKRLSSFGWDCIEIDGHDVIAVQKELLKRKNTRKGKPKAIIAETLKGRGIPGLQNASLSHIVNPKPELINNILENLNNSLLEKEKKE